MSTFRRALLLFVLSLLFGLTTAAAQTTVQTAPADTTGHPPLAQLIVQFDDAAAAGRWLGARAADAPLTDLSAAAGVALRYVRPMALDMHVLASATDADGAAAALAGVAGVAFAQPDGWMTHMQPPPAARVTPNDPRFGQMWHLGYSAGTAEGINAIPAWDLTTGSAATVVAVLDTGILPHSDLSGRTVAGYDFVADARVANDGNGRDNNPADPGDWITGAEASEPGGYFEGCQVTSSSWHGTHVAGTIGAATNNATGIAGVNWQAKIQAVRVLGKCGGTTSDILDGMAWAAGLSVPGVPPNATPAKVLNLSLGGGRPCSAAEQTVINAVVAAGKVVVVAAGNANNNAAGNSPASCNNVITVAATNRTGNKAYYSSYGSVVEISGPGGETNIFNGDGVLSTLDNGTTTPANSNSYAFYQGTSMATPHVAGVASLVAGLRPSITPAQMTALLQAHARPFRTGSTCNTSLCGAGIVDAYRVLAAIANINYDHALWLPIAPRDFSVAPVVNPFRNPGFEAGVVDWAEGSTHGWPVIVNSGLPGGLTPHGGSWLAWLGGDDDDASYIQQRVTVPHGAPYLAYWHWIASEDVCNYDYAYVRIDGAVTHSYTLCENTSTNGWVRKYVDLSAWRGRSVQLRLLVQTDGSLNSNLFVDDFNFVTGAGRDAAAPVPPAELPTSLAGARRR